MGASCSIFSSDVVPAVYRKRARPGCPSTKQDWGYPESMIRYIAENPSSAKVYQKTIQSCKYFFEKNRVLVVSKLKVCKRNVECDICFNDFIECIKNERKCCVKIDIAKLSSKIWFRDELDITDGAKNFTSILCSKMYRCEINRLKITNKVIMFDDLRLLTASAKEIVLCANKITFNDGKPVMLDKILESSPIVTEFYFVFHHNDDSTVNASMKNIVKLKSLGKIECFGLGNLPESLSIKDISAFYKKYEHVKIAFGFNENISENYKNHLDGLIDEIIESESTNRLIEYDGQDEEKHEVMKSHFYF